MNIKVIRDFNSVYFELPGFAQSFFQKYPKVSFKGLPLMEGQRTASSNSMVL